MTTKNTKGTIFNIIHGSFIDGYGIRTIVFLKGCPLRCLWCCNPEGQQPNAEIKTVESKCNECGNCIEVCPLNAATFSVVEGKNKVRVNRAACDNCGKCVKVCYTGALQLFGKPMTVDEVLNIVKRDKKYYDKSGGGVTIGGGEPTFQPSFTYSLLKKCQENNLHTAIDTCGFTLNRAGFKILKEADLLLYDLKGMNTEQHKINTGVSNERILANLLKLDKLGKPIIIRLPVVPGYNDSAEEIIKAAEFISKLKNVERVDILPYHEYGSVKYAELGKSYKLKIQPLSVERINTLKKIFESYGLVTQIGG